MDLNPHDLVRINSHTALIADADSPPWTIDSLARTPCVVIRRADHRGAYVPVGIRGNERGHRFAAWLHVNGICETITPYELTDPCHWKPLTGSPLPRPVRALQAIGPIMNKWQLNWGPTGSTAFELATGQPTLNEDSDLDLVINCPAILRRDHAKELLHQLEAIALTRLDIQLNTPAGGISLKEYTISDQVLVKTNHGPILRSFAAIWIK